MDVTRRVFVGDRQERDMNRARAVDVTFPLIMAASRGRVRSAERPSSWMVR
jgi:histidinol phosphatase-like enzyme